MDDSTQPQQSCRIELTELDSLFYFWELLFGYQAMARVLFELRGGPVDIAVLRQAYAAEIERRPVLNGRIEPLPEKPWRLCWRLQDALDSDTAVQLRDFSALPADQADQSMRQLLYDPFFHHSLRQDPPFFLILCRMPDGATALLAFMHHALADAHGISLVLEELFTAYNEIAQGGFSAAVGHCCRQHSALLPQGFALWRGIFDALGFLIGRQLALRFKPAAKIQYGPHRFHAKTDAVHRVIGPGRLEGCLAAAKRGGCTFNVLLVAAQALAIQRWKKSRSEPCEIISMEVHENLRTEAGQLQELSNKFAPFIIDLRPEDLADPAALLKIVQSSQEQARSQGIARKLMCLLALVRTRAGVATQRIWQNLIFNNPQVGDSSLVTNVGRVWTDRDGTTRVTRLGTADISAFYMAGPPTPSIGSYFAYLAYKGSLFITFNYYDWAMPAEDAGLLVDMFEDVLDEIAAAI